MTTHVKGTLTPKQKHILDFITNYFERHGYAPSLNEIGKKFCLRSVATVHQHIEALKNKGYLTKEDNQPRGVLLTETASEIPLLGYIAAGEPIQAIPNLEPIKVPHSIISKPGPYYALQVKGNSMVEDNIRNGDIVIVKQQNTAMNGQRVVALLNGEEVTLKKFYREPDGIRLQPANSSMTPIFVKSGMIEIQGIVIGTLQENIHNQRGAIRSVIPESKRPRGGCELAYQNKKKEEAILALANPAVLKPTRTYGDASTNKLVLGDNLNVLRTFYENPEIKGNVNLIYIDPPFGTGQDLVGHNDKSYNDRLVNTTYLEFLRERLTFLRELLSPSGSIYLHIDQKIGHYVKVLLDEIFGEENFRNDITRIKCNPKNFDRKAYGNIKDVIYFYSKSKPNGTGPMCWSDYRLPLQGQEIMQQFPKLDENGRRYATTPLHAKGETKNGPTGRPWKGLLPPKGRHWRYSPDELTRLDSEHLIEWSTTGNPRKIIYANENKGKKLQDVWDFKDPGYEQSLYPTEKNLDMLTQIILASSREGDLVLDCFAGSGTTLVAAEKTHRNWIGIDSNRDAVETAEKRLLELDTKKTLYDHPVSFSVYATS